MFFGFFHKCDLGVSFTFHSRKKNMKSSVIFLRNGVLILNGKEYKEATTICFEIRIPKKKNKELLQKVPSKIYGSYFIMEKTKTFFGLSIISNIITEKWVVLQKKVKVETLKNSVVKSGFLSHLGKQTRKGGLVNDK